MHVDGGAAKGEAVWAAIALWYDGKHWFYGGSKGDNVRTDCDDTEHHGAETLNANTAEVSALTWAMLFVLQFNPASCSIYYDSEFSAQSTQGLWNSSCKTKDLKIASGIFNLLHTVTDLTLLHEKAHSGLPYNELADKLCTVRLECYPIDRIIDPSPAHEWTKGNPLLALWSFLPFLLASHQRTYPIEYDGDDIYLSLRQNPVASIGIAAKDIAGITDITELPIDASTAATQITSLPIRFMDVNVNTWKSTSKRRLHLQEARNRKIHILIAQETRSKHTSVENRHGYILASSAAINGA